MDALLKLAKGDMRKVLNLLEASSMQRGHSAETSPTVDYSLVYQVAGKPTPQDIDSCLQVLLNETSIEMAAFKLGTLQVDKSLALLDICLELHDRVLELDLPPSIVKFLLKQLADIEFRLSTAVDDGIQLHGLIAVFVIARSKIANGL